MMGILKHSCLLLVFVTSVTCCTNSLTYGNITKDFDLSVGESLNIQCSLYNTTILYENNTYFVTSKDLYMRFSRDSLTVHRVDDLSIRYFVISSTINDTGLYSCYVAIPGLNKSALVCSTYVSIGYEPLPVQNFSCISYEFRNLNCSWVKPFNPVRTEYKLYELVHNLELLKRICPENNETSCAYTLYSSPQYRRTSEKLYFLMTGNNSLGKIKQRMSMDHYKIIIPGEVKNVLCTNVTQSSLVINWNAPRDMHEYEFPTGLEYAIQYQPTSRLYRKPTTIFVLRANNMQIEDLVPNTEYKITIRSRSSVVDNDDFWSPEVAAIVGTKPDVPYLAPEIALSSFEVETVLGNRTVTLYWKGIPAEFENGDKFHYVIQHHIHHVSSRTIRSQDTVNVGNKTIWSFPHLESHSAYIFKLYAANNNGSSYNASEIVVDKSDRLLERPKDIKVVSYGLGKYNLTWKASNKVPYNFTIFWCKSNNPRPYKCEGVLEWVHTTKTKHILQLPDTTNYQFAVAANDNGATSGMSWASCIVYYHGVTYNVKKVELSPKNATSLKVQWSLECEAQKIVMKEYAIEYCEFHDSCSKAHNSKVCTDWKSIIIKDMSYEEFNIGPLKPFTRYLVYMRVHTLSGWSGNSNLACEMTMYTAPGDPPGNVNVAEISGKDILVFFTPPTIPNGNISRYVAYYNKSDGTSHHMELRVGSMSLQNGIYKINLNKYTTYYTRYSIELEACVEQACSAKSEPVYAFTEMSYPDILISPRIEVTENYINISWENPLLSNGPLTYFQVLKENNNSSGGQVFNVSGENYLLLGHNCSENGEDKIVYQFRVRAVNVKNDVHLFGVYSQPAKTMLCSLGMQLGVIIGIVVGAAFIVIIVVIIMNTFIVRCRNMYNEGKNIEIQLPKDLDSPMMENPLSSYDKFKGGLMTNRDSGIPCDTSYERLCTFNSDEGKDIGGGINNNNQKGKRKSTGRNNSGESTASGKCHDSISSSNTTKTHLSIDSGAEIDSPPSPDTLFSDSSSSHTTPRSYKPDLTIVRECNGSTSKDSGLDKDGSFINHNLPKLPSKFAYFVKKRDYPFSNIQLPNSDLRMPSYSKFAVLCATNAPSFIPYGEQNLGWLENSLSNSEPSVADFDTGNGSEPLVPYSKFGIARSAGNGLNVANHPIVVNNKIGYSKFGTVYRALKPQENIRTVNASTCSKFLPHNPQTFPALTSSNAIHSKHLPGKDNDRAYSKYGVSCPQNVPVNGYIKFKDTLTYPTAETSVANPAYSKLGMTPANEKNSPKSKAQHIKENGIVMNPAELSALTSQTSYVPFKNAKGMKFNDSLGKDNLNDAFNKEANLDDPLSKEDSYEKSGNSFNAPEEEQSVTASHKPEIEKDSTGNNDKDCIISTEVSPSLLDEITFDLGSKFNSNFSISANNDSMGILLQDNAPKQPVNQLSNIMDALFGVYNFIPGNPDTHPICINLEEIDIVKSPTCNNIDGDASSTGDILVESRNFCKQCNNKMTECSCSSGKGTEVICNGHASPLRSDFVPKSCNSTC